MEKSKMSGPTKRPPAERGQGRKSVQGGGKSPVLQVVVSPELKAKATRNGAQWVRDALTKAKEITRGDK
mgnify:CR=1 FL=1